MKNDGGGGGGGGGFEVLRSIHPSLKNTPAMTYIFLTVNFKEKDVYTV